MYCQVDFGWALPARWTHIISPYLCIFHQVIQKNQNLTSKMADPPSAAILAVYLDQAHELPVIIRFTFYYYGVC